MDYIYQELDPAQAQAFEAALDKCPECKEKLEAFQRTRAAMRELDDLAPPPSVSQLLLDEAARAAPAEKVSFGERLRRLMRVFVMHPALAAAATLVVVLGVSFVAYRKGLPPAHRTPTADSPLPAVPPAAAGAESRSAAAGVADDRQKGPAGSASSLKQQAQVVGKTATTGDKAPQSANASPDNASTPRAGAAAQPNADSNQRDPYRAAGPVAKDAPGAGGGAKLDSLRKSGKLSSLKSETLRDRRGQAKRNRRIADGKNKGADKAFDESTNTLQTKRRARRRSKATPQRRLYRRTRGRAANVIDVGGGSSGVWGGRSRYRYQQKPKAAPSGSVARGGDDDRGRAAQGQAPAPAAKAPVQLATPKKTSARRPAEANKGYTRSKRPARARARRTARRAPPVTQARRADQKRASTERESKKVKKKKARDPVARLLAEGSRAVKRGDCQTAFARFNEAMRRRPYVIGTISSRVGSCYATLLKSKRYRVLAQRISSARNPRQYRARKRAAPRRAAPAKPAKK